MQFDDTESIFWHASTEPDLPAKDGSSWGEVQEYSGYSWRGQNIKMFAKKQQCMPLPESVQARNGRFVVYSLKLEGDDLVPTPPSDPTFKQSHVQCKRYPKTLKTFV